MSADLQIPNDTFGVLPDEWSSPSDARAPSEVAFKRKKFLHRHER